MNEIEQLKNAIDEEDGCFELPENFEEIETTEVIKGKVIFYIIICRQIDTEKYFKICIKYSNTGYWQESDYISHSVIEVEPKQVTVTKYVKISE